MFNKLSHLASGEKNNIFQKKKQPQDTLNNNQQQSPGDTLLQKQSFSERNFSAFQKKKQSQDQSYSHEDLLGSKFRLLNQFLYTKESKDSNEYFQTNKDDFLLYHQGFQHQIKQWPVKPIQEIIRYVENNEFFENCQVCDLGCGDGLFYEHFLKQNAISKLKDQNNDAQEKGPNKKICREEEKQLESQQRTLKNIYSFDLVSHQPFIRACDIAQTPLKEKTVELAIFCLALMGTNYLDFILQARRIIQDNQYLIIAEVNSRIQNLQLFSQMIQLLGFEQKERQTPNDFFTIYVFKLTNRNTVNSSTNLLQINKKLFLKAIQIMIENKKQTDQRNMNEEQNYQDISIKEFSQAILQPCLYKQR